MNYTIADVAKISGAKRRSVQLWADAGVLMAEPETEKAGTGTHRQFSRSEVIIACLINPIASQQVAIGVLLVIALFLRVQMNHETYGALFSQAAAGGPIIFLVIVLSPGKKLAGLTPATEDNLEGVIAEALTVSPTAIAITLNVNECLKNLP